MSFANHNEHETLYTIVKNLLNHMPNEIQGLVIQVHVGIRKNEKYKSEKLKKTKTEKKI